MAGLRDIAPLKASVEIRGTKLSLVGVDLASIGMLVDRFPELRALLAQRELSITAIAALGNSVVAALIAAATGECGDQEAEAAAAQLPLGDQLKILTPVIHMTMPDGPKVFIEQLTALMGTVSGGGPLPTARSTKSP